MLFFPLLLQLPFLFCLPQQRSSWLIRQVKLCVIKLSVPTKQHKKQFIKPAKCDSGELKSAVIHVQITPTFSGYSLSLSLPTSNFACHPATEQCSGFTGTFIAAIINVRPRYCGNQLPACYQCQNEAVLQKAYFKVLVRSQLVSSYLAVS